MLGKKHTSQSLRCSLQEEGPQHRYRGISPRDPLRRRAWCDGAEVLIEEARMPGFHQQSHQRTLSRSLEQAHAKRQEVGTAGTSTSSAHLAAVMGKQPEAPSDTLRQVHDHCMLSRPLRRLFGAYQIRRGSMLHLRDKTKDISKYHTLRVVRDPPWK